MEGKQVVAVTDVSRENGYITVFWNGAGVAFKPEQLKRAPLIGERIVIDSLARSDGQMGRSITTVTSIDGTRLYPP
nr:hypothetical protein [Rhodococcus sp. (in: high G+C Gram-positive bacteria)]